jgi:tetratricopeptide (TPR) repeat protein
MALDKSILILFGMVAGFVSIYLGYKLFLRGIEGSSTLEGEVRKMKLTLRNASPGLFFALFGAFIIVSGIYKPEIHSVKKTENGKTFEEAIHKGELKGDSISRIVSTDTPKLVNELLQEANDYVKNGKYDNAKSLFYLALMNDWKNDAFHNNLANIYLYENKFDLALNHAAEAISYSTDKIRQASCYETRAKIYHRQKNYKEALQAIQKAVSLAPTNRDYLALKKDIEKQL